MRIAYNPKSAGALISAPTGNYLNAITFDLAGHNIYTRGELFKGTDTTYEVFKKHTTSSNTGGYNGLVPVPNYNNNSANRFLREDSTWALPLQRIIKVNNTTILAADDYNKALNLSLGNWIKLTNNNGKVTIDTTFEVDEEFTGIVENSFTDIKVDSTNLSADTTRNLNINSGVGIALTPDTTTNSILIEAPIYKGATSSANGKEGIVPAPTKNNVISYLRGNGTWSNITTDHIVGLTGYAIATTTNQTNLVLKTTDSLNVALGKLENKANLGMDAYNWYKSITAEDTDAYINKWQEIVDFLNEVKDADGNIFDLFVTISTDQTIIGSKTFASATILQSTLSVTGATTLGNNLTIKGNIIPNGNNTYNLGSGTSIWNNVYASNFIGDLTGNADSATVLLTGRKINGTTFNGSKDIITEYWGTARNITITDGTNKGTATSVNGSTNYELKLPTTIIASIIGNVTGNADSATVLKTKRKINGTNFDGSADITTEYWGTARTLTITDGTHNGAATSIDGSENYTLDLPDIISANIIGDLTGTADIALKLGTANKGSAVQGIYLNKGVATPMTYSLNATVNAGALNKLAYYSGANTISAYGTKGSATLPIYINNGVPTVCDPYTALFTDISNNTTTGELSLTIGGTTKKIIVNYASNAGNASSADKVNHTLTFKPGSYGTGTHTFNGSSDLTVLIPSVKGDIGLGNVLNTAFYKKVVTVNGTTHNMAGTDSNAAFGIYAPTSSGTTGLILKATSNGTPVWINLSAITAGKLGTDAGSATNPVYFAGGVPVACTYSLKATLNGGAAGAVAYYSGANAVSKHPGAGGSNQPVYIDANGVVLTCNTYGSLFTKLANEDNQLVITVGGTTKSLTVAYASVAGKLGTTDKGDTYTPIYLNDGTATVGTSYAKAIKSITRSGHTCTCTHIDASTSTFSLPQLSLTLGEGNYVSSITASGHTITVTRATLPTLSVTDDGTGTFVTDVTASGHTITLTRGNVPNLSLTLGEGNYVSGLSVSGHKITATRGTLPTLSLEQGSGNYISSLTVSGHKITATRGTLPTLSVTDSGTGTFVTDVTASGHTITLTRGNVPNLSLTQGEGNYISGLSVSGHKITATRATLPTLSVTNGTGNYVTSISVNGHAITANRATLPTLSLTDSGTGTYLTGISVSGHAITVTRGSVTIPTLSLTLGEGNYISSISVSGHKITANRATLPTLSLEQGSGNYISSLTVSGHKITATRGTLPTLSVSDTGTGTYVTDVTASGHTITLTRGNAPSITVSDTGTGTYVTDVTASGHTITLTRGNVTIPGITVSDSGTGTFVTDVTASGHTVTLSRGNVPGITISNSGSGNAVTGITASGHTITVTKGSTFSLSSHNHNSSYVLKAGDTMTGSLTAPSFYASSDANLKTNIQEIINTDRMPIIKEFDWKENGLHSYGLIAQELEEMGYSELVDTKEDGYKAVNYSAALSLIVGKLQNKIIELEKEINMLLKRI